MIFFLSSQNVRSLDFVKKVFQKWVTTLRGSKVGPGTPGFSAPRIKVLSLGVRGRGQERGPTYLRPLLLGPFTTSETGDNPVEFHYQGNWIFDTILRNSPAPVFQTTTLFPRVPLYRVAVVTQVSPSSQATSWVPGALTGSGIVTAAVSRLLVSAVPRALKRVHGHVVRRCR